MNQAILEFLYHFAAGSSWLTGLTIFVAVYLPYMIVIGLGASAVFSNDKNFRQKIIFSFVVTAALWFIVLVFKEIFSLPRPFEILPNIVSLFPHSAGGAFPSGHATFFSALAGASFFLSYKRLGFWLGLAAILVVTARVAAGVHWPTDILAGLLIGSIGAWALVNLFFLKRNPDMFKES